jgi:hypothetical protein
MTRSKIILLGTVTGGLVLYIGSTTLLGIVGKEPWMSIAMFASFIVMGLLCAFLTRSMAPPTRGENLTIAELEKQGLLTHERHEATRAFEVEEFEDEGCQYFVGLKNNSVLFLCGQYLYDYVPADDGRGFKRERKFPCTEFTLHRDKRDGLIVDVACGGTVLEPEGEAPHFSAADFESGRAPEDGQIISDRSYDQIRRELMKT